MLSEFTFVQHSVYHTSQPASKQGARLSVSAGPVSTHSGCAIQGDGKILQAVSQPPNRHTLQSWVPLMMYELFGSKSAAEDLCSDAIAEGVVVGFQLVAVA